MAEISFLCVHKKLRKKRLSPVMIKEVTRRINKQNVWQALYVAGEVVPHPFAGAQYFHRNLNPKKTVEVGFTSLPKTVPMSRFAKQQKLHEKKDIGIYGDIRPMEKRDLSQVYQLYKVQQEKYAVNVKYTQDELAHQLLPRKGVIYTLVVENKEEKKITDFISFYNLPTAILKCKTTEHNHT